MRDNGDAHGYVVLADADEPPNEKLGVVPADADVLPNEKLGVLPADADVLWHESLVVLLAPGTARTRRTARVGCTAGAAAGPN